MRRYFTILPLLVLAALISGRLAPGQAHPYPPGVHEADKVTNAPLPDALPTPSRKLPPAAQLRAEADELARLSAGIPAQIALVNEGQMPKDLGEQLKRIEKLAKHLRSEVLP